MGRPFISFVTFACIAPYSIPGAAAAILNWDTCKLDSTGKKVCKNRIPRSARIAITVGCVVVLLLIIVLVVYCIRRHRRAAVSKEDYNVEASQVDGPPTIVDTAYHRRSGLAAVYSDGGRGSPEMSGLSFPVPAQLPFNDQSRNHTAPASRVQFPSPPQYPNYQWAAPNSGNYDFRGPKTAVPESFYYPRPLLTGNRLKDRLKERPASASSLVTSPRG